MKLTLPIENALSLGYNSWNVYGSHSFRQKVQINTSYSIFLYGYRWYKLKCNYRDLLTVITPCQSGTVLSSSRQPVLWLKMYNAETTLKNYRNFSGPGDSEKRFRLRLVGRIEMHYFLNI
ncbi:hypothetical protein QTP88_019059 [Uroleucon formosanum]